MITDNLFERVLLDPAKAGSDTLYVVSGYATPAMVEQHLGTLRSEMDKTIALKVIVGMTPKDGIGKPDHTGFVHLAEGVYSGSFQCSYLLKHQMPVHSKMYAWFCGDSPRVGYVGSANYTQQAFLPRGGKKRQGEVMENAPPGEILEYFSGLEKYSCYCTHQDAENVVGRYVRHKSAEGEESQESKQGKKISLLDRDGNLPQRSGLNWGQRPEANREPNQAYIRIPKAIYKSEFFPDEGVPFTIYTDDGQGFVAARRQAEGKAIHSTANNSIIGEYFRRRIGVPLGAPVTKADLEKYGQTEITFYQIDDSHYYMDFSPRR